MKEVSLVSQGERCPSARGTEALRSCFRRPGRHSMTTGSRESSRSTCRRRGARLWRLQPQRAAGILALAKKKAEEKAEEVISCPFVCYEGCRARGAFVLSKRAAQDAPALRADDLRPRRRDGASWSQILCRNGRSVRRGCARVAQPKTAARTAAPAAQSLLRCQRLCAIVQYGGAFFLHLSQCPRTVRRSRSVSRRAPLAAAPVSLRARSAAANAK